MRVPSEVQESTSPQAVLIKYLLSCSASMVAETVTYPLDITKTRLQISQTGLKGKLKPRGMLKVTYNIAKREGMTSLWQGLAPAIYRHYVYTGIRTAIYEYVRGIWRDEDSRYFSFWKSCATGLLAGAVAQFFASPADLVKVQMQMEGLRKLQKLPPRFKSSGQAFVSIYRTNGFFGMWTGWIPNCQRAALVNMADMATYDRVKHFFLNQFGMKDNAVTHACASSCSGLAAAIISTPADVVKTRIMDQLRHMHDHQHSNNTHYVPMYKGSLHCFMHIIKHEGFFALYKGFLPIYMRMAPWSLTFWVSYEEIRRLTGAPSF